MNTTKSASSQLPNGSSRHVGDEETLWEDDIALIVLEADGRFFCVRRAVLCLESQIFHDMLELPQYEAAAPNEQYEGKPLIHFADKATELQVFLKALHQYRLYYLSPESHSLSAKATILRLSTKYEVHHLRERTIQELSSYFPATLAEYDKAQDLDISDADFRSVTAAIEETNAQILLPVTRYMTCRRRSSIVPCPGGLGLNVPLNVSPGIVTAVAPALMVHKIATSHVYASERCLDLCHVRPYARSCASARDICLKKSMELVGGLDPLHKVPLFEVLSCGLCKECAVEARRTFEDRRRRLWDELPGIFGLLLPWEELAKAQ